jgi:hypothetical protein
MPSGSIFFPLVEEYGMNRIHQKNFLTKINGQTVKKFLWLVIITYNTLSETYPVQPSIQSIGRFFQRSVSFGGFGIRRHIDL